MKLVDILAGGLKDWPEGVAGITQGPGSGVLFDSSYQGFGRDIYLPVADDAGSPASCVKPGVTVSRAEWQAAVDALNAPKVVEWDGVGLPPIGRATCEYLGAHKFDEWTVVNIFANYGHTVFVDFGDGWRAEEDGSRFRSIRTADQVAAEERERVIQEICKDLGWRNIRSDGSAQEAAALYEAGYRKQVKA